MLFFDQNRQVCLEDAYFHIRADVINEHKRENGPEISVFMLMGLGRRKEKHPYLMDTI
jgi:hypothetical protein